MDRHIKREEPEGVEPGIEEILRRVDSLPVLDSRTPDEIIGYDADGLPT